MCAVNLLGSSRCLAKAPSCLDLHRYSQLSPPQTFRFAAKAAFKKVKRSVTGFTSYRFLRDFTKEGRHPQTVRFYSSSNKDAFKAKAPIGIFDEAQNISLSSSLGGCLGQSFNQLSRCTNVYFKRKEDVSVSGNASAAVCVCRSQRISTSQAAATEQNVPEGKDTAQTLKCEGNQGNSVTSRSTQETSGLQLFHISSLVTRFGESYSYVAHHVNAVFSQGLATVKKQENLESGFATRDTNREQKRRKMQSTGKQSQVKLSSEQETLGANSNSSTREEGYLHFARHINEYLGAKVTNEAQNRREEFPIEKNYTYEKHLLTQSTSQTRSAGSQLRQEESIIPEPGGIFHSSCNGTKIGENVFQTCSHIDQCFKGQRGLNEFIESQKTPERLKSASFMNYLCNPTSAIPDLLGAYRKLGPLSQAGNPKPAMSDPQATLNKKVS